MSSAMSTKILRESIKLKPGRFSTFSSMARTCLADIPHPSTYAVKPQEEPKVFSMPSRPRAVYERPKLKTRDLPSPPVRWPLYLGLGVVGVSLWAGFILYTTNQERLSSSVVRQFISKIKRSDDPQVLAVLGENIELEPTWFMGGKPWINGQVSMMKGNVDVSARIRGSKGAGTAYFTSIRREKGVPFIILRFKIICDDGTVISLADRA
ncbi:hypothetical protein FRC03_009531 [Tulasnella sp. 419]|nr:hypothetical protein FRC03_009531 [Tulasnella sp. 419]